MEMKKATVTLYKRNRKDRIFMFFGVKALSIILICWCSLMIVLYLGVIVLNDIEWAPPG